jgi:hypothetical protein
MRFAAYISRHGVNSIFAVEFTGVGGTLSFGNAVFFPINKYMIVFDVSENASANCSALCTLNFVVTIDAIRCSPFE